MVGLKGIVIQTKSKWVVEYETGSVPFRLSIPLHQNDITLVESGDHVQFMIVDEFTHPELFSHVGWGDGITCAKIIS